MPNVILPNLGIELPDVGSDQDTWGDILNNDLTILDKAVQYDVISKTLAGVDVTLTDVEAASAVINLTGTLTANVNVIVPATPVRVYLVRNQTSGAFTVTVKTAAGTGTPVQQGTSSLVYSDGTNVVQGATSINGSFAVSGALTAGSLNNTPVGNTTPSSGAFTTLSASGATTLNGAVTLGDAAGDAINVTGTATFAQATQFPDGTAALPAITNTGDTNTGMLFPAADTWAVATAGSERFRIDPAGNAGLGVTPSAWGGAVALQIAPSGSLSSANTAAGALDLGRNFYFDGTNFRYLFSGTGNASTLYEQSASGSHSWFTAPSGTAGNPITFTQALTLFQAGQLLLGSTSLSTGAFAEFTSTTGALIVPRMTTAQRDALGAVANGAIIYNTTTNKMNFRENATWVQPTVTAA